MLKRVGLTLLAVAFAASCESPIATSTSTSTRGVEAMPPLALAAGSSVVGAEPGLSPVVEAGSHTTGVAIVGAISRAGLALLQQRTVLVPKRDLTKRAPSAVITASANMRGELNLCDCKPERKGGLARRAAAIEALRELAANAKDRPIVLDSGDALSPTIQRATGPEKEARAEVALKALGAIGLDAMLVNGRDLVLGVDTLKRLAEEQSVPLVSANIIDADGNLIFEPLRIVERDKLRIAVIGLTAAAKSRKRDASQTFEHMALDEAYRGALAQAKNVDAVILLSGLGLAETERVVKRWAIGERPDMALVSGSARLTAEPRWSGGVPILEAGDRARQLLALRLYANEEGELELRRAADHGGEKIERVVALLRRIDGVAKSVTADVTNGKDRPLSPRLKNLTRATADLRRALKGLATVAPGEATPPAFEVEELALPEALMPNKTVQEIIDTVETEGAEIKPTRPRPTIPRAP